MTGITDNGGNGRTLIAKFENIESIYIFPGAAATKSAAKGNQVQRNI